jgi:cobalt-zinc-cadmium efflux system protein
MAAHDEPDGVTGSKDQPGANGGCTRPAAHGHAGHSHGSTNERRVFWAGVLTCGFMIVEAGGGIFAGSLALLADAGHMLTDSASLALAWLAFRIARRPADWKRTYGFDRFQVLAAFVNGLALFVVAGWVVYEAVDRFADPVEVLAGPMLAVAAAGLVVNIATFLVLHGAERDNLNIRSAMLHVMSDLLGSVGAMAAAGIIMWTGWTPIDPILSILVSVLILRSAWRVVGEAGHILLEGAPADLDIRVIEKDLNENVAEISHVHHVHAWSLTQSRPMVTLQAVAAATAEPGAVANAVKARLKERFGVGHVTVEVEHGASPGAGAETVETDETPTTPGPAADRGP